MSLIQSYRLRRPPLQRNPPNDTQSALRHSHVINNMDNGLLILSAVRCDQQPARRQTCDTHCSAVVQRIAALTVGPRPSDTATRDTSSSKKFSSAFSTLFCYSG